MMDSELLAALMLGIALSNDSKGYVYHALAYERGPFDLFVYYRSLVDSFDLGFEPEKYISSLVVYGLLLAAFTFSAVFPVIISVSLGIAWRGVQEYI